MSGRARTPVAATPVKSFRQEMAVRAAHRAAFLARRGDGLVDELEKDERGDPIFGRPTGRRVPPPPAKEAAFVLPKPKGERHVHSEDCLVKSPGAPTPVSGGIQIVEAPGWFKCNDLGVLVHDHGGVLWAHLGGDRHCKVTVA